MQRVADLVRAARRLRPQLALACVAAGFGLAPHGPVPIAIAAVLVAGASGWIFGADAAPLAAALVLAACLFGIARIHAIDRPATAVPPGTAIEAVATLLEHPRATTFGSSAPMRIETGPARGLRVLARVGGSGWPAVDAGVRMRIHGFIRATEPPASGARSRGAPVASEGEASGAAYASAPGASGATSAPTGGGAPGGGSGADPSTRVESNAGTPGTPGFGPLPAKDALGGRFDYAAFLRSRGIGRELRIESMRVVGRRGGVAGVVDAIRRRAERGIGAGLSPDLAALARGMVLGEDGDVPDETRDDFRRSGLAHLLAASGQNVALLCALALPLLMLAGASPRARVAVLLPLVGLYVALAGSSASVVRAGVMAAAGLAALAAGRPASGVYALLLAAAVTLGLNPRAAGDPGWQLSFAAVAGMLALGPSIARLLRGAPRALADALGATAAATLATSPLLAHDFGAVSVAALPANVIAFPAVAPIMWIGMGQAAAAQADALGVGAGAIAAALERAAGLVGGLGLRWVVAVARRFADPVWAQSAVHLGWPGVAASYLALAAAFIAIRLGPIRSLRRHALNRIVAWPRTTRHALAAVGLALIVAGAALAWPSPRAPSRLTVDYLDVGQGDATLIRDPYGAAVLFDGGPPEGRVDRVLRRLGVRRLSAVVATHQSRDHHGGLLQVVRRFPVGLFLDGGDGTRDPTFVALEREVDRRGIPRRPTRAGESLSIGAMTIRTLWPPRRQPGPAPTDPNPRATVAIVSEHGFDLFLSADAESPTVLPLALPRVEAIKVPHHGSADPGLPQILARLRPVVAGIEVGRDNPYGHPRAPTLDALRARVPRVYRTDRDGTVELTVDGNRLQVRTHR
jgi:competence protein ComEC